MTTTEEEQHKIDQEVFGELTEYLQGFLAGKSQATKEILEEEIKFLQILCMSSGITTYAMSTVFKRIEELKQQLKKLGEGK